MKVIYSTSIKVSNLLLTDDFSKEVKFKNSPEMGNIFVEDGRVTEGKEVVDFIESNPNMTFLVSKGAFDYLKARGILNVCMFDFKKADRSGKFPKQGGLIYPTL